MTEVAVRQSRDFGEEESAEPAPTKKINWAEGEEEKARTIFGQIDKDGSGAVTIRELIISIRKDAKLAETLKLPQSVRQEDGTRDELEKFFQALDTNGDRSLTFDEFSHFFADKKEALEVMRKNEGDAPALEAKKEEETEPKKEEETEPKKKEETEPKKEEKAIDDKKDAAAPEPKKEETEPKKAEKEETEPTKAEEDERARKIEKALRDPPGSPPVALPPGPIPDMAAPSFAKQLSRMLSKVSTILCDYLLPLCTVGYDDPMGFISYGIYNIFCVGCMTENDITINHNITKYLYIFFVLGVC